MWGGATSLAWNIVVDFMLLLGTLVFFRDTKTPLTATRFIGARTMWMVHRTISLDDIKAIKNAMDCAITLHFQSYMNKMEIVVAVDEPVVPDPHELLGDLADSLKLIKDAAVSDF